jgi:hypothetical protein
MFRSGKGSCTFGYGNAKLYKVELSSLAKDITCIPIRTLLISTSCGKFEARNKRGAALRK